MDSTSTPAWPTQNKKFLLEKFLYFPPKKQFFKWNIFSRLFERTDHLAQPNKEIYTQEFLILMQKKTNFSNKINFHTCNENPVFHLKK